MSGYNDDTQLPEADVSEQHRDVLPEPQDPEQTVSNPVPDGVEADPADVIDQASEVPGVEDEERREG